MKPRSSRRVTFASDSKRRNSNSSSKQSELSLGQDVSVPVSILKKHDTVRRIVHQYVQLEAESCELRSSLQETRHKYEVMRERHRDQRNKANRKIVECVLKIHHNEDCIAQMQKTHMEQLARLERELLLLHSGMSRERVTLTKMLDDRDQRISFLEQKLRNHEKEDLPPLTNRFELNEPDCTVQSAFAKMDKFPKNFEDGSQFENLSKKGGNEGKFEKYKNKENNDKEEDHVDNTKNNEDEDKESSGDSEDESSSFLPKFVIRPSPSLSSSSSDEVALPPPLPPPMARRRRSRPPTRGQNNDDAFVVADSGRDTDNTNEDEIMDEFEEFLVEQGLSHCSIVSTPSTLVNHRDVQRVSQVKRQVRMRQVSKSLLKAI